MTAFLVALVAAGWRPGQPFPTGHALLAASGAAFTAVVIGQVANAFACRSATRWPGALGWTSNRLLLGAVAVELLALAGLPAHPPGGRPARSGPAAARRIRRRHPRRTRGAGGRRGAQTSAVYQA